MYKSNQDFQEVKGHSSIFTRWEDQLTEKRAEWAESEVKKQRAYAVAGLQIVCLVGLTHVALVLRHNLAFWLPWNGSLLSLELDFSVISAQRWKVCSHKSTCLRHCTYRTLKKKKKETSTKRVNCIIHIFSGTGPSTDKLTDCAPGLYPFAERDFFFSCSCLRFVVGLTSFSLTAGWHPPPLKLHASTNSAQFNHQTIIENPVWGSNTAIGVSLFIHILPVSVFLMTVVRLAAGSQTA